MAVVAQADVPELDGFLVLVIADGERGRPAVAEVNDAVLVYAKRRT